MAKTILVVEDDRELRDTMEQFLSGKGYNVVTSSDGWDCLREIVVKKPDLVLMDINMPKMNGLNALDLIKVTRLTAHTPIIVMSSQSDKDTILKAGKLGADDFIEKPFSYEKLSAVIAIQLLTLPLQMLQTLLRNLRSPDSTSALTTTGHGSQYADFDAYPVLHQEIELCILLPKALKPSDAAALNADELHKKVIVLAKGRSNWKCIFPAHKDKEQQAA